MIKMLKIFFIVHQKLIKKKSKPKIEKSISEKSEQKSDQSIPKWMQVSKDRFDFLRIPYTYTAT